MRFPRKKVGDWIQQLCGHKFSKDKGSDWALQGKLPNTDYGEVAQGAIAFLTEYPDWRTYKAPTPEVDFNLVKAIEKQMKSLEALQAKLEENGYMTAAIELEGMSKALGADLNKADFHQLVVCESEPAESEAA